MRQQGKQHDANEKIYVWTFRGERIILKGKDIWYVHTEQRKLFIHTHSKSYRIGGNLKEAVERLKGLPMVKTHSAYLVHLDCLESINAHCARLKNGVSIPVSERCWKQARPVIEEYYMRGEEAADNKTGR